MKNKLIIFILLFLSFKLNAEDAFEGTIDLNGTFWVRMMGYDASVPKWIKCELGVGTRTSQGINQTGDIYRQNNSGTMGSFFPSSKIFRVESDLIRPSVSNYKIQVLVIRDSRFQGKNVTPLQHQIWSVFNSNQSSSVPMSGEYICIDDTVGGGSHYNYIKSHTGSTEIILYDRKRGNPVYAGSGSSNTGSYDSYGTWIKGTPIITNWKGASAPHPTLDKYENDPKYAKYKSQTYSDPEQGRKDDTYVSVENPNRLGDGNNDILGSLADITDVEGCIDLEPLSLVTWNINTYINEVQESLNTKFNLEFFEENITDRYIPDYTLSVNFMDDPIEFIVAEDGKLNAGDYTSTLDDFFSLTRSLILIAVSLIAIFHVISILRK